MGRQRKPASKRLRQRSHGVWYADFRNAEFREVLQAYHEQLGVAPGGMISLETRDEAEAERKANNLQERLLELKEQGVEAKPEDPLLRSYMRYYVEDVVKAVKQRRPSTVKSYREQLEMWHELLWEDLGGKEPHLSDVTVERVQRCVKQRLGEPSPKGGTISSRTVRQATFTLSRMMEKARKEGKIGDNPVPDVDLPDPPKQVEREFLTVNETARLITAARELAEDPRARTGLYFAAVVPSLALTGGRKNEVLALTWDDVDFEAGKVHFRDNEWRTEDLRTTLKTAAAHRSVPLWPQLREVLEWYRKESGRESGLVFPSPLTGRVLRTIKGALDSACERAGVEKEVTCHTFRHTYCAARLMTRKVQSRQGGLYVVMEEMGHSDLDLIRRTYGHVQDEWPDLGENVAFRETTVTPISQAPSA